MFCLRVEVTLSCGSFTSFCGADVCQELASLGHGDTRVSPARIKDQGKSSGMTFCWGQGMLGLQEPAWWSSQSITHPPGQLVGELVGS